MNVHFVARTLAKKKRGGNYWTKQNSLIKLTNNFSQKMERILVTGGNGLLAHAIKKIAPRDFEISFLDRAEFDLLKPELMAQQLSVLRPNVVVNTAAYNLVDRCEIERELSWAVNATAPEILANLCAEKKIRLVHFGTDYVFDGVKRSNYVENDLPNPLNHYGAGKLAGEQAVLRASEKNLVLRTSWVFGGHPTQTKTFIHTILKMARSGAEIKSATDQASVPTFSFDLAQWTLDLIRQNASGLFHAVNDESVSRFDWAKIILEEAVRAKIISNAPPVEPVLSSFFNSAMRRPDYTIMSNAKLSKFLGRELGSWRDGLRKMLAEME
jgi:dTDP-4-dehydrorhamnose reductase